MSKVKVSTKAKVTITMSPEQAKELRDVLAVLDEGVCDKIYRALINSVK